MKRPPCYLTGLLLFILGALVLGLMAWFTAPDWGSMVHGMTMKKAGIISAIIGCASGTVLAWGWLRSARKRER